MRSFLISVYMIPFLWQFGVAQDNEWGQAPSATRVNFNFDIFAEE